MRIGKLRQVGLAAAVLAVALTAPQLVPAAFADDPAPPVDPAPVAEPRIVGGEPASTANYPWMVALLTSTSPAAYCGGALVAPDRVVTAAHCIVGHDPATVRVIAGRTDLRGDSGQVRRVAGYWAHPEYTAPMGGDDVAILALDQPLPYETLPVQTDPSVYQPGRLATILGWGYTTERGPSSSALRTARVPLIADSDCAAIYRDFDPGEMVCAGDPERGVDACYGDSGGPMVADGRLIGITSWGSGCARPGTAGVYTRVTSYADDIQSRLRSASRSPAFADRGFPGTG